MLLRPPGVASDGLFLFYIRAKKHRTGAKRRKGAGNGFPAGVWGETPTIPKKVHENAVSEQNAKHSTIETGLS